MSEQPSDSRPAPQEPDLSKHEYVSIGYLEEEQMYCLTLNRHHAIIMRHVDRAVVQHTVDQINADYRALQLSCEQAIEQREAWMRKAVRLIIDCELLRNLLQAVRPATNTKG